MNWLSPVMINVWAWLAWLAVWIAASRHVQRTEQSEGFLLQLQHKVPQLTGFFLIFHDGGWAIIRGRLYDRTEIEIAGTVLTVLGLAFATWARVHLGRYWSGMITLKQGHKLIRSGPYRITRHPIYTGLLAAALGSAATAATADAMVGFVLIAAANIVKLWREEALMIRQFGEEYLRFKGEVPALVPLLRWHRRCR